MEDCVDRLPNNPALLYAIAPPPEALPRFYVVLYPGVTEPADAEAYVDLVKQLNQWRAQMEENQKTMEQMLQAQEGTTKEMFQDVYTA